MKFPIRAKLIVLMSGAVLIATAAYLAVAVQVFKEDKVQLIYELNASTVKTLSAQTESYLLKVVDKIRLLTQGHRDPEWVRSVFESEPDLIAYTLYSFDDGKWVISSSLRSNRTEEYLKLYGKKSSWIDELRKRNPIDLTKVKGITVYNSTWDGGAPLLTIAMNLQIMSKGGLPANFVALVDLKMDQLLKALEDRKLATVYLITSEGNILAHPDVSRVFAHESLGDIPIVRDAVSSIVKLQLKTFEWKGTKWLGAYASVGVGGLFVISQIPEEEAFVALTTLLRKSLLFSLLVLTVTLLVSGWVARGFTEPLRKLLSATEKIARWEFGGSIHVKTRDEIGSLARSFNSMSTQLMSQRKELDSYQKELELKVIERTQSLEEEKRKLSEAQDALLRTTRLASVGELAGAAAHEVLNPVNNMNIRVERIHQQLLSIDKEDVSLMTEIITSWKNAYQTGGWKVLEAELTKPSQVGSTTLGEEDLQHLVSISGDLNTRLLERTQDMEFLNKEMIRITRIMNNMRALSRVGGERRALDVHVPIDETCVTLGDLFKKKNVQLVKEYSAEPRDRFSMIGDRDELVQVFSNLLRNALHAVSKAQRRVGEVRIQTHSQSQRIEIRIVDNGSGISSEHLGRLFEPNFTTKSVEEGTGLGLSISRRLVRAFGGDLELEKTEEGVGTTFLIWFPHTT